MRLTLDDFRRRIEYSLCQQFASEADVRAFCARARAAGVGVACFNPVNVRLGVALLAGSGIEISSNVGFPFGSHLTEVKQLETERSVADGATQIDMVIQVGALRSGQDEVVLQDIRQVVRAAAGRPVKTIIETWVLTHEELERACRIAQDAGAALVKTTSGVRTQYLNMIRENPRGAEIDEIRLMRRVLKPSVRIKASGGICTLDDALSLLRAGADQLGMSRGEEVVREFRRRFGDGVELGAL
jgi:deoxyribose-phosphate aldolase